MKDISTLQGQSIGLAEVFGLASSVEIMIVNYVQRSSGVRHGEGNEVVHHLRLLADLADTLPSVDRTVDRFVEILLVRH